MTLHKIRDKESSDLSGFEENIPIHLNIPAGYYASWFCTSQAANSVYVLLFDDSTSYFSSFRQSTDINPPLSVGHARIQGDNLRLTVLFENIPSALEQKSAFLFLDDQGNVLGKTISLAFEDDGDQDYNDLYFNIVAWKYSD